MITPPAELVERVVGIDDVEAYERSGYDLVDQLRELLSRAGYDLGQFRDVYDFGSGPGRLARALHQRLPKARVTATDIDEEAIAWLSENAPGVDVRVTS